MSLPLPNRTIEAGGSSPAQYGHALIALPVATIIGTLPNSCDSDMLSTLLPEPSGTMASKDQ
jgi:hypothetical protein